MLKLIDRAKNYARRTALIAAGRTYTYGELLAESESIAAYLLSEDLDLQEKRVAFMATPGMDYVKTQWGIWRAGGIAVPLCTSHPLPALRYTLEDSMAEVLVVSSAYEALLKPLAKEKGLRFLNLQTLEEQKTVDLPVIEIERRAMILYTSGTTSKPKGVVTTHRNIEAQIQTLTDAWQWSKNDHILCVLPLHHVHGIINVLSCALWSGAVCEFLPKFEAAAVFDIFKKGAVNLFMAVPTIYYKLIHYWDQLPAEEQQQIGRRLRKFRLMVSGSAALPVSTLEKWRTLSGHTLLERYGMTEIGMALSNSYTGQRKPGYVGLPLKGVELRLVDEEGSPVSEEESGEIQVKGPNIFLEYWNRPEATAAAFSSGWFRTGDMAVFEKGAYKILGRNSVDIIKSGGYKISALEIEEVLRTHPLIKDCGVVGILDEEWGEIVAASLIAPENKPDLKNLSAWLRERLPAYKIPRLYIFQEDLPRNTLGKVTKNELKRRLKEVKGRDSRQRRIYIRRNKAPE